MKYRNLEEPYFPVEFSSVLRWAVSHRLAGRRRQTPRRYVTPRVEPDRALLASAEPSITWVGHATWLLRLGGLTLYTDPIWSRSLGPGLSRNAAPALPLEEAPPPDVVLISHNHRDHLDATTVKRLGPAPLYVVPEGLGAFFRRRGLPRVVELPWWGEHEVRLPPASSEEAAAGAGGGERQVRIAFVPSQHWSRRGLFDQNDSLWGGFVVEGGGRKVYFAGDTAWFSGFAEIGRRHPGIDAALLPIGAYDPEWFMRRQHMNPEDAVRAFRELGARLLCAMHWGTFKLTDEPLDEPPALLEDERTKQGVPAEAVWVAAIGESRRL